MGKSMGFVRAVVLAWFLTVSTHGVAGATDNVACPTAGSETGTIYTVEHFEQVWCWPPFDDAPLYRVETRTNGGPWLEEAVVNTNQIEIVRDLGDVVSLRVRACRGSHCSDYSDASRPAWVLPDFDINGDDIIGFHDYLWWTQRLSSEAFSQFMAVFGKSIVGSRYE